MIFDENSPFYHINVQVKKRYGIHSFYFDIEAEIMNALAMEITAEIDKEILNKLQELSLKYDYRHSRRKRSTSKTIRFDKATRKTRI